MPDFGIMRGFNEKLFGDKLVAGQLPTQLGLIGSLNISQLLLDLYPNAAAAYSLRKLRTLYTGNAIRVRRSSDNTESDIGFTALGNLDTSALTFFCGSGNGFVTTWYDQSGNGRNATQSTAGSQPQIVSSGSVILDGSKPLILPISGNSKFFFPVTLNTRYYSFAVLKSQSAFLTSLYGSTVGFDDIALLAHIGSTNTAIYSRATNSTLRKNGLSFAPIDRGQVYLGLASKSLIYENTNYNFAGATSALLGYNSSAVAMYAMQELIVYANDPLSNISNIESNINTYYAIY